MRCAHIFCGWSKRPKPNESRREMIPMHDQTIWQRISTAPFGCDLELAVIEEAHVHQLVSPAVAPRVAGSTPKRTSASWSGRRTGVFGPLTISFLSFLVLWVKASSLASSSETEVAALRCARAAETIASSPEACRSTDFCRGIERYPGDQRQLGEAQTRPIGSR
jgi:hypothetical protein